ncbi:MAG: CPBP family intramembrane glutamic endopeptidase [Candidatus Hodarchaeales archaeon]
MRQIPEKRILLGIVLAFILWYVVFLSTLFYSFWYRVTGASLVLMIYTKYNKEKKIKILDISLEKVQIGIISGIALYSLFFIGFSVFKPFVSDGAVNVYRFRSELSLIIPAILLLITSFCEESFWRAFIQEYMFKLYGRFGIIITSLLYALIHLPTFNYPLVFAALIAGLYWGLIYVYTDSIWVVVFSHIAWTELVFVLLPLK